MRFETCDFEIECKSVKVDGQVLFATGNGSARFSVEGRSPLEGIWLEGLEVEKIWFDEVVFEDDEGEVVPTRTHMLDALVAVLGDDSNVLATCADALEGLVE